MAEGHLCVTMARYDAEVAFRHDKSCKNGTFDFYRKSLSALVGIIAASKVLTNFTKALTYSYTKTAPVKRLVAIPLTGSHREKNSMNKNQFLVLVFCLSLFACGGLKKLETYIEKATTPAAKPKPPAPEPPGGFVYSKAGLIFPVPGKGRKDIISKFGDPRDGGARIHEGIDIAAPRGTAVLSVSNGKVISVKDEGRGGKQVWIKDTDREYVYYYAHLNSQSVQEGDRVMTGTEIGTVGNTGNAKGATPHLHFGIYENDWLSSDDVLDPLPLMP